MSCHIVILGAGISGLATAWFLKQSLGSQVVLTLLEKTERAGGWIQTLQTEEFLFEQGARSCRSKGSGRETLVLVEALGLQDQVLVPHPSARHRYLFDGKGLRKMPSQLWEIPFRSLTRGWAKALWRDWWKPKRLVEDESIHDFFSRRLGLPWVEELIDPFVSGIYAGNCQLLSLKSCFPLFDQWEQEYGSLLRGAWHYRPSVDLKSSFIESVSRFPLFSFKEGMETLPRTLAQQLKECVFLGEGVSRLKCDATGIEVELDRGKKIRADYVISTLSASALSSLLINPPAWANQLKQLQYTTVVVVNIGFHFPVLPFQGFGYLVPSKHHSPILGCVWDSSIFPQQNREPNLTRLTLMMGGSHHPEIEELSDQEIIEYALKNLRQHLGIRLEPQMIQVKKAQNAIPQYQVGYGMWKQEVQEKFFEFFPRLILSGTAWNGVSINDCIAQARKLATKFGQFLECGDLSCGLKQ